MGGGGKFEGGRFKVEGVGGEFRLMVVVKVVVGVSVVEVRRMVLKEWSVGFIVVVVLR